MPYISTRVNKAIDKETEKRLSAALGQAISLIPGKSESWLMLNFEDNCRLYFKGDSQKGLAFVTVKLFGGASAAAYDQLTAAITQLLSREMDISPDGIYVQYEECDHWGWNGVNF